MYHFLCYIGYTKCMEVFAMEKMKTIARRLDIFFRILQIMYTIAAVAAGVCLLLTAACFLFRLDPEMIGTGYNSLDLGFLELELAQAFAPDKHIVLAIAAAELAFTVPVALLGRACMAGVRRLLEPMKQGLPFHGTAASGLKRLALFSLIMGVLLNISGLVNHLLTNHFYNPAELFSSEKISAAILHFDLDFTFLVISGILLLLSYVFHYGQSLQQLSDETL